MKLSRLVLPALLLAAIPLAGAIMPAESAPGDTPPALLAWMHGTATQPVQFGFSPGGPGGPGRGEPGPGFGHAPARPPGFPPPGFPAPGAFGPGGGKPSPRLGCQERIHGEAAMRAHLRSSLALDAGQREAWARMEALLEPVDQRSRDLCATLPAERAGLPGAPDRLAFVEKQLGLQHERLRLLQAPFREFYQTLSPEQRATLDRLPPRP